VERCADDETGARGAAIYAAMSQGLDDARQGSPLLAPCEVVEPDARDASAHADFNAGFNELIDSMSPVFTHISGSER
jgi:L-xylulokinase